MAEVIKKFNLQTNAIATGNGTPFNTINKMTEILFTITGSSSSRNVVFEYSFNDGSTWIACPCVNLATLAIASTTTGTNESWSANVIGANYFRTRISAVAGGDVDIVGKVVA